MMPTSPTNLPPELSPRLEVIRNAQLQVIGFREIYEAREVLRDRQGRELGEYDHQTKVTRDSHGRVVGVWLNQLLRLL